MKPEIVLYNSKKYVKIAELKTPYGTWNILSPLRFLKLLWHKLTQWAEHHINWPAVGFWIVILFCAAFWCGVCRLIWWVWYCL